jgi:hypothetical protein
VSYPATKSGRRVLMISAGMLRPKKARNSFAPLHRYLNYGLLGLATRLRDSGHRPTVFHGHFEEPESFIGRLANEGWLDCTAPIFLSVPSSYALPWAKRACERLKALDPSAKIIVGGRWVVGTDSAWVRSQIPGIDLVVYGLADDVVESLLDARKWKWVPGNEESMVTGSAVVESQAASRLDYSLLDNHQEFTPSFEVSRGCGRGCSFCAEANVRLGGMKHPAVLADEIESAYAVYGHRNSRSFFEASLFQPTPDWIQGIGTEFRGRGINMRWRSETRVDHMSARQVGDLASTGLKVLDLGLESASPAQLLRMKKTPKPDVYLRKASDLLKACHDAGIWAKVNVLLYPGETADSVDETKRWLEEHRTYIKGVSSGPLILYRYGDSTTEYLREIEQHGASVVDPNSLSEAGYSELHLSRTMPHEEAVVTARAIAQEMMSARDYFDLKAFSYFSPDFTYDEFMAIARVQNVDDLPFRLA